MGIPYPTFASRWAQAVRARGGEPFLIWEGSDGRVARWTYGEFDALVDRVAGGLATRGVRQGSRVSVALRNSPAFVAVWLALVKTGAVIVPSDPSSTASELVRHLRKSKASLGVCARQRADVFARAASEVGIPAVEVDEDDVELDVLAGAAIAGTPGDPAPTDLAGLMFTSGTTSEPKCVMVTQANYAFAGDVMAAAAGLRADDRQFVVLPVFHANAQYYSFAAAISAGASVALMHAFSATRFLAQAARHEVTHASLFAAPIRMILARGAAPVPGLRLTHCWYAQNITQQQYDDITGLLGCRPRQLYGMTETVPAVLTNRPLSPRPDAMGQVSLGCQVDVRDPVTGRTVAPGEVGDLVVGGVPGVHIFAGYLDDPATTAASLGDGWFVTGDRATLDAEGNLYFAGRGSDVLKVAGENVSVVEIESVLAEHPAVLEAAVVGEPDEVRDEVPVAYVVRKPTADPGDLDGLGAWCAERLAKAKRPARFEVVDELPRTSVGKIRKFLLTRPAGS